MAGGDAQAFERLYHATSAKLFGVCLRLLADRNDAEDVLQDVYAAIWRKAAQYDAAIASPISWLAMIAHNKAIDRLRSDGAARNAVPIELAEDISDTGPGAVALAEHAQAMCAASTSACSASKHGAARSSAPPSSMARRTKNSRDAPIRPSAR